MKECSRCKDLKPVEEFSRDRSAPDGLDRWCKACKRTYDVGYRAGQRTGRDEYLEQEHDAGPR